MTVKATAPAIWTGRRCGILLACLDSAAWALALTTMTWFRFALESTRSDSGHLLLFVVLVLFTNCAVGSVAHLYGGRYCVGSLDEAIVLARVVVVVGVFSLLADLALPAPLVPRSVPPTAAFLALFVSWSARCAIRLRRERTVRPDDSHSQRVVIFGAGSSGQQLVRSMLSAPTSGYLPVALLDDAPAKRPLRVCGVPVLGTGRDVAEVGRRTNASLLVIAVRTPDATVVRVLSRAARKSGLGVRILPSLTEVFGTDIGVSDLRDVDVADLIGRRPAEMCVDAVEESLAGKRILVTGAGGSIGSELCRQLHRFRPAELYMLDRDESALHSVRLSIHRDALLDSPDVVLCDIRDAGSVRTAFERCRPDVVFHAAALKHLPMLEQYPLEAWKNNVLGTHHVLEAARSVGVRTFVNISTDKAANPTSVLGRSKRIAERLTAGAATGSTGVYLSVRFGNVLGSRGSVLSTFTEQLARGGPITITDPDVTRFFMTIPEAVHLVVQASVIGRSGEALVLDMGAPVRIADLAHQLMEISGKSVPVVYTGLRKGEKLHEELFGEEEVDTRPLHPAISHVAVPPLDPERLWRLAAAEGEITALDECSSSTEAAARTVDVTT